jgi:carbohydrate diacid regulator
MKEKLTDLDIQVVLAFAENNMNASKTSKSLFFHRNTVIYHLDKVKRNTGLDPFRFYDLMELILCLKEGK